MCNCKFAPYKKEDIDFGEESFHYLRICGSCSEYWYGLHCKHVVDLDRYLKKIKAR